MMMHQTQLANHRRHPSPLTFGWSAISFILLALLTLLAAPQQVAHAGDSFTWTGEGDGITWTDACNWHPKDVCKETYPGKDGDDDSATIMSVAAHVIHPGSVTLQALTMRDDASLQGGDGTAFTPLYHPGDLTLTVGEQTGNLSITEMTLNHQSVADGQWVEIGDDGTIDGNQVRVSATVANDGPARSATMQLVEADTGTELTSAAPVDLPTGASTVELDWDTTGYAWAGSAEPRSDLQLELHLESADATATQSASILVAPKPVVLVHGLWSDANAWSSYGAFLSNRHPHWRAYAVGDGQFPGVMDTGSLFDPFGVPNTIYENAEILAGYVQALRESRNAWQVDIVAHSLGGLISRQYIQSFMPDLPDDQPAVHQLLMLGTPNLGSQCALDFPFIATYELRPDVVASFNGRVDDQHGVPFSILAGNPLPFTCSALVTGDMVVPVDSAFALPYVTDQQLTGSLHIFMNGSQADFDNFVLPRLALGPGSSRPEQATTANLVMPASPDTTAPSPQLIAVETVQIADLLDVALPVPPGDRFGVTLLAPASVAVFLEDPTGALVQSIASDDPLAQEPIRAFNIANPATGAWNLRLENSGPEPATAVIIAWIQGNPLLVQLDAGAPAGTGQIALSVNVADGDTPVTQATVHATLTATSGEQHQIELHDNGLNGDDAAGDGIYSAILHSFTTDEYLVVVEASTPTVWRATTGSITVNANTHYLFLPLMRQSH